MNENDTMSPATGEAPPKMIWPGPQYDDARAPEGNAWTFGTYHGEPAPAS